MTGAEAREAIRAAAIRALSNCEDWLHNSECGMPDDEALAVFMAEIDKLNLAVVDETATLTLSAWEHGLRKVDPSEVATLSGIAQGTATIPAEALGAAIGQLAKVKK